MAGSAAGDQLVSRSFSMFKLGRFRPPVRRVLAIDAGSRRLRLLLAESNFGRLRVVRQDLVDLQAEGLVSTDETLAHLQTVLESWGRPPLAIVIPQHLVTSQTIDLPTTPEAEVEKLIRDETLKLSGVSETRIVYDFVRMEPAKNRQQFWVTIGQEGHIRERIDQLGVAREILCEVTTTSNALITAYRAAQPDASRAILVHLGAQTTVVVILVNGQGAFATSFPMGGDFFTRAVARLGNGTEENAEILKRQINLLTGPEMSGEFHTVVDGWVAELKRQLNEWFAENPEMAAEVSSFEMVASGDGFLLQGLYEYLSKEANLDFKPWPGAGTPNHPKPGFEIAYGTALQALGHSPQPVSLLPEDFRLLWKKRLVAQRLEFASLGLVLFCAILLAVGTWHKLDLLKQKTALLNKARAGQESVNAHLALRLTMVATYDTLRPVYRAEQNTRDMLQALAVLQHSRSNRSYWVTVFADQRSYFDPPLNAIPTNRPAKTNPGPAQLTVERPAFFGPFIGPVLPLTNTSPARPGCIVELTMPEQGEPARAILSQVVGELQQAAVFGRVDSLSDDLRKNLADPQVTVGDSHFVLALDFAETDFLRPLRTNNSVEPRPGPGRRQGRVSLPTASARPATGGRL